MKRVVSILIVIVLFIASVSALPVSAAPKNNTINDFSSNTKLTAQQYGTIREGKYKAHKENGVWYYIFSRSKCPDVWVKISAFTQACGNSYTEVNNALTNAVTRTDAHAVIQTYTYKKRTTSQTQVAAQSKNKLKKTNKKTYTTYIAWLSVLGNRAGQSVDLECTKKSHVQFTYSDKVYVSDLKNGKGYKAPSTAKEYEAALSRTTSYSLNTTISPRFTLEVTKPGKASVCLSSCEYKGKGIADTKTHVTKYIDVATTTAKVITSLSVGKLPIANLYSLAKQTGALVPKSQMYITADKIYLSPVCNGKTYTCLKGVFKSPIKLKAYDDKFRTEIMLSKKPTTSGNNKTVFKVSFTI